MQNIRISDVTLKETQKAQNVTLSFKEKLEIAKHLDRLGVTAIELPPIVNEKSDSILIKSIAAAVKGCALAVPCALDDAGIETVWKAVCSAKRPRLQLIVPTSTVQMEFLCHKKPAAVLQMIADLTAKAKALCPDVEFIAQDATRSEREFLFRAVAAAADAGATVVTLSDDAGIMTPQEFIAFFEALQTAVPQVASVTLGVQCSDEFNMGCACCVAAATVGVREIKSAVSCNTAVSMAAFAQYLRTRGEDLGLKTDVRYTELVRGVKQIDWILNTERSKTSPFDNGVSGGNGDFALTENDSAAQVTAAIRALGYELSEEDNANVYTEFKRISRKKTVTAKDLDAIIASVAMQVPATYVLESYVINSGNIIRPTANITLKKNGETISGLCSGDGPIDSAILAIEQIVGHHYELDDFQIQAVTEGREAMGSTLVRLRSNGKLYSGNGISTDIIGASVRAYLNALNKIVFEEG